MWQSGEVASSETNVQVKNKSSNSEPLNGKLILMDETDTYAQGVQALRDACEADPNSSHPQFTRDDGSLIYRPLTFKETIQEKVDDFNKLNDDEGNERNLDDRLRFFDHWVDSSTGIAYKAGTKNFKIVQICQPLVCIDKDFDDAFLTVGYESIEGIKLISEGGTYNKSLSKRQVLEHEAWQTTVEEDKSLLKEYCDIVFAQLKERYNIEKGMGFYVVSETDEDQLRALFVFSLDSNSYASGSGSLSVSGSFLRVAP